MKQSILAYSLTILFLCQGCKHETAQWRGPDRDGIFHETGLLDQWPGNGPELLWVYEGLGRGYAAPAVLGDRIYINGEVEGKSYLFALDTDGKLLWKSPNGDEFLGEGFSSTYPGARSTPTLCGKLVYTTSGNGRIACFDASSGKEKWARSITADLDGMLGYFGYSESVAVDKDLVYCYPGGASDNLAALHRITGETAWTSEVLKDTFAYGSAVLVDLGDRPVLIGTSWHYIFTVDRSNGKLLATYELEGDIMDGEHCNTPVYKDGHLYFVANDEKGQGTVKLELSQDGETIREVWRNPDIRNNFDGFVIVDDHLLTTIKGNKLVSLDPDKGIVADSIKVDNGSIVYTDNKLICYGNNGTINLIRYHKDGMEVTGTVKVKEGTGHHFSHPVLSGGVMYIRHGNALLAYGIG
ncbi:MAG: PQQ-binding-like beta-propeller repeat protein [Bacteroidota bacterium]